jgi:hypothetical protein
VVRLKGHFVTLIEIRKRIHFLSDDFNGKGYFGNPGVDGVIILKWTLKRYGGWIGFS